MLTFLCQTADKYQVYVDLELSHAATHFRDTSQLKDLVIEVLTNYNLLQDRARFDIDMQRIVGKSALVRTSSHDQIVYAIRPNRKEHMRFVKNRAAEDTSYITIDLRKKGVDACELFTADIGRLTPHFPGQPDASLESIPFWESHALVWGSQQVIPGTETTKRTW